MRVKVRPRLKPHTKLLSKPITKAPSDDCPFSEDNMRKSISVEWYEKEYEGPIFMLDTPTRNGNIYKKDIWEKEINSYRIEEILNTTGMLCEYKRPRNTMHDMCTTNPMYAAVSIKKLWIDDNKVMARFKFIRNEIGDELSCAFEDGNNFWFSIVGVSSFATDDVKLITFSILRASLFEELRNVEYKRVK